MRIAHVQTFLLFTCVAAIYAMSTGFPGFMSADWQQMLWEGRTGLVTDYRSWLYTWIGHAALNHMDALSWSIVTWAAGVLLAAFATARLRPIPGLLFTAAFFCPFWQVPFNLTHLGTDSVFMGLMLFHVSSMLRGGGVVAAPLLAFLRPNAALSSLYASLHLRGWRMSVCAALSLLALVTPPFVIKTNMSAEFKAADIQSHVRGELIQFSGPGRMHGNAEVYGVNSFDEVFFGGRHTSRTAIHDEWQNLAMNDPFGFTKTKVSRFTQFFSPANHRDTWIYPSSGWRDGVAAFAAPGFQWVEHRKGFYSGFALSSPLVVIAMVAASVMLRRAPLIVSLYPVIYMLTFLVANVNFSARYMAPSAAAALYILLYSLSSRGAQSGIEREARYGNQVQVSEADKG